MARKSKREITVEESKPKSEAYNVGIYLRLSIEEQKYKNGSESIENQRAIIFDYIKEKNDMIIYAEYCDNGETGTNFEREGFQQMMYDVYNGKVNCIIVKDLSRFGREYIEAGDYLERIFPLIGVRFIAVNDHYDNKVSSFDISIQIKNIINSVYAKDISKKCAAALRVKQANGEFIGTYAAYGYMKSKEDKHKIEIDEKTAPVVKQIFEWKTSGMGYAAIIKRLYEMKIAPPARYRYDNGIIKDERAKNQQYWNEATLKSMLSNEVYIGNLTQGRRKSFFFDGKKEEMVDRENWVVTEGTNEPIVSRELFDAVQNHLAQIKGKYYDNIGKYDKISDTNNMFKGKLICGCCGSKIARMKRAKPGYKKASYAYICRHHAIIKEDCDFNSVNEESLKAIVFNAIKMQILYLTNLEKAFEDIKKSTKIVKQKICFTKSMSDAFSKIAVIKSNRMRMVSDFARGIISEDEYKMIQAEFKTQLEKENQRLDEIKKSRDKLDKLISSDRWIMELKGYASTKKLTKEMVDAFISQIRLYPDKRIEIEWNYCEEAAYLSSHYNGGIENAG